MSEVILKAIADLGEATKSQVNEAKTENAASVESVKADVKVVRDQIDIVAEQYKQLEETQKEMLKKQGQIKVDGQKSFNDHVKEVLTVKAAEITNLKSNSKGSVNMTVKAAATMTTGNYSGGTVGLTQWDPSFAQVARRNPFLRQLVNVRPVGDKYVAWAEQANRDGGAGQTAEGAAKTQADFDIVEANKVVEKITSYIKVSKEALDDIPFLNSEINSDLLSLINLKLDADLLSGTGTTPAIKGILPYATTFSAPTGMGLAIEAANQFDALRAAIAQIENAFFSPNYIVLHPTDVALIDSLKSTTNEYLVAPFGSQYMFKTFYGIPVVSNTGMTRGDFLVGDFSKSNLGIREDVNIQVGYENDDFTKNLITILAEMRAVHYIKSNHTTAFVKGTFATVQAALETA